MWHRIIDSFEVSKLEIYMIFTSGLEFVFLISVNLWIQSHTAKNIQNSYEW